MRSEEMDFGRLMTAMVTPFNENLEIDYDVLVQLVEHLIATKTETIVVSGTTGESPTLSDEEKLNLFAEVVKLAKGRIKVIAGTGSNDTNKTIRFTKETEKTGVDGIMLVTPYYNKPSQEGLYNHFKSVAMESKLPIMIYNIPSRAGINIKAETIIRLSKIDNIFAVKEASGDIVQISEIIKYTDDNFYLYSGDDKFNLPVLAVGGYGSVSVASHVVGKQLSEMTNSFVQGDIVNAMAIHLKLINLFEGIFITSNPSPIKDLLIQNGINVGGVRLPLMSVNAEQSNILREIYKKAIET